MRRGSLSVAANAGFAAFDAKRPPKTAGDAGGGGTRVSSLPPQRRSGQPTAEEASAELLKTDPLDVDVEILAWAVSVGSAPDAVLQQAKSKLNVARVSQAAARELADAMSPSTGDEETTRVRQALQAAMVDAEGTTDEFFAQWDADGSGTIDRDEFYQAVRILKVRCTRALSDAVFESCDADSSGEVDYNELHVALYGDTVALDLPALQRAIDSAGECAWRCPQLGLRVSRARELLEVGRTAQAEWRVVSAAAAPPPLEIKTDALAKAIKLARKSGVAELRLGPLEAVLAQAIRQQDLVAELEAFDDREPLEVDLVGLGSLISAGEVEGVPTVYLDDARDVWTEARRVQVREEGGEEGHYSTAL